MILTHIFDRWYLACMECTHAKIRKNHQGTQVGFIILSFSHSWIIDKISTTAASYVAFHGAQQEMYFTLLRPTRLFVCGIHLFRDPLHRSRDVVVVQYYSRCTYTRRPMQSCMEKNYSVSSFFRWLYLGKTQSLHQYTCLEAILKILRNYLPQILQMSCVQCSLPLHAS